ncbi:MAG TPA: universal stress protein [Rubneribacter badeniensis]|uniref:Universal stress protein n=1 Tax=Rubneribacter badeniensis TaxID=2070688 RepID=A0A9D3ADR8_9ACTN|nr:universal stress protein [Rubneribacter badeniensis]
MMDTEGQRIFAALDETPASEAVARTALALAERDKGRLLFGHVADALPREATMGDLEALRRSAKERLERNLANVLKDARESKGIASFELAVEAGPAARTVVESLMLPFEPDLVVCGRCRTARLRCRVATGVGAALLRAAPCNVLVVDASRSGRRA